MLTALFPQVVWQTAHNLRDAARGILHHGRLISWARIQGYLWVSSALPGELTVLAIRPKKNVLQLRVARRFTFLAQPKIYVGEGHSEELENVLGCYLSKRA